MLMCCDCMLQDVCTSHSLILAKRSDSIEVCVKKMLNADIRHLPVLDDDTGEIFGLISVKDLVKEVCTTSSIQQHHAGCLCTTLL
jgi:CBS-domain-containing membrane protein